LPLQNERDNSSLVGNILELTRSIDDFFPSLIGKSERLFSSAKLLITDHRPCLKADIIEANECLRSWYGRPEKGSFDYSASGQPGAGPRGPEVGGEGQGDEGLRRKRTSSQGLEEGEKGSGEVGEDDSSDEKFRRSAPGIGSNPQPSMEG
jgi:hypothetical protein